MNKGFLLVQFTNPSLANEMNLGKLSPQRRLGNREGFSLVELSIVLVILGLLTGGILAGQSLIRAAELRSVTTGIQKYNASIYTFREKYFALPGDMRTATDFWGNKGGDGTNDACIEVESADSSTCSGDGSGDFFNANVSSHTWGERFLFWQHLANAGLIEGAFTGAGNDGGATNGCSVGVNCPQMKIQRLTHAASNYQKSWGFSNIGTKNSIYFGMSGPGGPISSGELWGIDTKMDDGRPAYGKIISVPATAAWGGANCMTGAATASDYDTAEYNIADDSTQCSFYFLIE